MLVFLVTHLIIMVGIQEDDSFRRHSLVLILTLIVLLLVIILFRRFTARALGLIPTVLFLFFLVVFLRYTVALVSRCHHLLLR